LYPSDQLDFDIKSLCYIGSVTPGNAGTAQRMSTARLTAKLGRAGYDLDRLEELDRGELLEALAEAMLVEPALGLGRSSAH